MPNLLRNVIALIAGFVLGGGVNMAIIMLSPFVIAPPAGVDVGNARSLAAAVHRFEPRHFVMPFLAHALGSFAGALAAFVIAAGHRARMAWAVGVLFLCGGLAASFIRVKANGFGVAPIG